MNLNKVQLIGRIGKKPEVNYIKPDTPVARFSLATSERGYTTQSGAEVPERTEWHSIVVWRGNAKFAENYLDKGMLIYIEGKLQTRKWEGQDGITRTTTEIVAEKLLLLEKKNKDSLNQTTSPTINNSAEETSKPAEEQTYSQLPKDLNLEDDNSDDLPF